ncbi:hypothetical protein NL676_000535 [Syzygium grande]|nr:hypothetical protein NL676_000535 [Syzygium grande]
MLVTQDMPRSEVTRMAEPAVSSWLTCPDRRSWLVHAAAEPVLGRLVRIARSGRRHIGPSLKSGCHPDAYRRRRHQRNAASMDNNAVDSGRKTSA